MTADIPHPVPSNAASAILPTYARANVTFERGEGVWLVTADGERYLDFGAGIAVNSLGHSHPHLVAALTSQAAKLWHTSNLFPIPEGERLARRLVDATFADHVFFTNSGAEALECAIKMARKYHSAKGEPDRYRILTFEGAFHGRTLATIAAGGQRSIWRGSVRRSTASTRSPSPTTRCSTAPSGPATAAILIEPIQGEGGVRNVPTVLPEGTAAALRREGHPPHPRRGADRRRAHRQALRP